MFLLPQKIRPLDFLCVIPVFAWEWEAGRGSALYPALEKKLNHEGPQSTQRKSFFGQKVFIIQHAMPLRAAAFFLWRRSNPPKPWRTLLGNKLSYSTIRLLQPESLIGSIHVDIYTFYSHNSALFE